MGLSVGHSFPQLPKRDRAMCLFNSDFLQNKVQDALVIVGAEEEEEEEPGGDECFGEWVRG